MDGDGLAMDGIAPKWGKSGKTHENTHVTCISCIDTCQILIQYSKELTAISKNGLAMACPLLLGLSVNKNAYQGHKGQSPGGFTQGPASAPWIPWIPWCELTGAKGSSVVVRFDY